MSKRKTADALLFGMVLDTLSHTHQYASLHPAFARAFEFLNSADWAGMSSAAAAEGASVRHAIDGDRMYVSIDRTEGRGRERSRLEAHRHHIDIQLTIEGHEEIGWRALADCALPDDQYDEQKDVEFFSDTPESWLSLPAGHFAIFFPDDAHAPLAGRGLLTKAVMKIAVE
jgi:biofilm protein TabA